MPKITKSSSSKPLQDSYFDDDISSESSLDSQEDSEALEDFMQ
jgi:hypothetical protein